MDSARLSREMMKKASVEVADGETERVLRTRAAAVLVEKLKEFRQSYNRVQPFKSALNDDSDTHGQVCEFFEQAHVIEKIYQQSPGPSKTNSKREPKLEESDEEEGCNEQKTWSIKQKLTSWRAVMREVVGDVCPNLQLENQTDINPGLMKHVLDEIRKLKTELAFQHNTILELTHQLENHQSKNQRKDRLIEKLLVRSREIRLEGQEQGKILFGPAGIEDPSLHHQSHPFESFDQDDCLPVGDLEFLRDLSFDLDDMVDCHGLGNEIGILCEKGMPLAEGSPASHQPHTSQIDTAHELHSYCLTAECETVKSHGPVDIHTRETVDSTINDTSTSSVLPTVALGSIARSSSARVSAGTPRWRGRRMLALCGRLGCAYVACKVMQRGSRRQ